MVRCAVDGVRYTRSRVSADFGFAVDRVGAGPKPIWIFFEDQSPVDACAHAATRIAWSPDIPLRKTGRRSGVGVSPTPGRLLDNTGKTVGKHGANFSFEHDDGSRLVSTIAAYDEASKPTDLRWLLLTTRSFGNGAFENVTHVQRVNTSGGMPPARCEASQLNQLLRVDFTSDFVFYRPRPD